MKTILATPNLIYFLPAEMHNTRTVHTMGNGQDGPATTDPNLISINMFWYIYFRDSYVSEWLWFFFLSNSKCQVELHSSWLE
jgi:hypothetical protein